MGISRVKGGVYLIKQTLLSKFKIKPTEAQETIDVYYKLTGERIKTPDKLEQVYKTLQEYLKKNAPKLSI